MLRDLGLLAVIVILVVSFVRRPVLRLDYFLFIIMLTQTSNNDYKSLFSNFPTRLKYIHQIQHKGARHMCPMLQTENANAFTFPLLGCRETKLCKTGGAESITFWPGYTEHYALSPQSVQLSSLSLPREELWKSIERSNLTNTYMFSNNFFFSTTLILGSCWNSLCYLRIAPNKHLKCHRSNC